MVALSSIVLGVVVLLVLVWTVWRRTAGRADHRYVDLNDDGITVRNSVGDAQFHMPLDEIALVVAGVAPDEPRRLRRMFYFFDRRGTFLSSAALDTRQADLLVWLSRLPGFEPSRVPPANAPEQAIDVWRRAGVRCPRCDQHELVDVSRDPAIATGRYLRPLYACACGRIVQIGFHRIARATEGTVAEPVPWSQVIAATVSPRAGIMRQHLSSFDGFFALRLRDGTRRIVWSDSITVEPFVSGLAERLGMDREALVDAMLLPADETELGAS